jgi:glycosyltransferase involved in cell wall biosynthesis
MRERWQDCVNFSERGFSIGNTDSMLGANPMDRLYRPHVYYNYALGKLGRVVEAAESCKKALEVCPDDPGVWGGASGMVTFNLKLYNNMMAPAPTAPAQEAKLVEFDKNEDVDAPAVTNIPRDALVIWAMQLWKQVRGDILRERAILDGLPVEVTRDPTVARMRASTERRAQGVPDALVKTQPQPVAQIANTMLSMPGAVPLDGMCNPANPAKGRYAVAFGVPKNRRTIVFWIGPAFEPWDATTPNTRGIGGSETACIEVAKNLVALGHHVTVYGDLPGKQSRVDDGVEYHHYETFQGVICDVFIASRAPAIMEHAHAIRAKVKLLWVHDIHVGPPAPQMHRWLLAFDRILCLSEWHKGYFLSVYPFLHPSVVEVTRNGIDPSRFLGERIGGGQFVPAKYNHMVWSSSPNRGLDMLLHNFQLIRSRVPDAELHIYYGFDCWETLARQRGATEELAQIERFKTLINDHVRQGGVHFHGRRPQSEVAAAYMRAKVWGYLTGFPETSCITAMEAQAAGCVPVASSEAALAETVKHGILLDNKDPETPRRFVEECVHLMQNDAFRTAAAEAGRKWALENLSWRALAEDWVKMFERIATVSSVNPVHPWVEVK